MNLRCPVHPILHGKMEWTSQGGTWACFVCGWSAVHLEEWYRVAKPLARKKQEAKR